MMFVILIHIVFIPTILLLILVIIFRYKNRKKESFYSQTRYFINYSKYYKTSFGGFFHKEQSMFQTLFVVISIYLSVLTFSNNQEQLEITNQTLASSEIQFKRSDSVSDLNIKLLNSLNTSSSGLLNSLNNSSSALLNNIENLSKSISNFPQKIDSITHNLIKLNNVINEQKRLVELESNRKPILKEIDFKYENQIISFYIINEGFIDALIENISISFDNQNNCIQNVSINGNPAISTPFENSKFQIYGNEKYRYLYDIYEDHSQLIIMKLLFEEDCINNLGKSEFDFKIQITYKTLNQKSGYYVFNKKVMLL